MTDDLPLVLTFSVFVIVVLQLVTVTVMAWGLGSKRLEALMERLVSKLHAQTERQSVVLGLAIQEGTDASKAAQQEANTVNQKLTQMGIDHATADRIAPEHKGRT